MSLRIRRGTDTQRSGVRFDMGEIVWTTDLHQLWVGDGVTTGGVNITKKIASDIAGTGLTYNTQTGRIDFGGATYTTDVIAEGTSPSRQYFTVERAQDAAAAIFTTGVHSHISFVYNTIQDEAGRIDATVSLGLNDLSNVNIVGTPSQGQVLKYDTVTSKWIAGSDIDTDTGILAIVQDTTPELGGDLSLNSFDITGTGNIDIIGDITGTTASIGDLYFNSTTIDGGMFGVEITSNNTSPVVIKCTTDGGNASPSFTFESSRGTVSTPVNTLADDVLGSFTFSGYHTGTYVPAAGIIVAWDSVANFSSNSPASVITFGAGNNDGSGSAMTFTGRTGTLAAPMISVGDGSTTNPSIKFSSDASTDTGFFHPANGVIGVATDGNERARFDNGGLRVDGFVKVAEVSGVLPGPAEPGMIILDNGVFKGYNGTAWVTLG